MTKPTTKTVTFSDDRTYTLDDHGFLFPPEQWDEAFAEGMAAQEGVIGGLTDVHWSFIQYIRRKFLEEKTVPLLVYACAENKMRLSRLRALFPSGYHRGACRIAGINFDFMTEDNIWHTYETPPPRAPDKYRVDTVGFLESFDQWDEGFAMRVAHDWKLPSGVTDRHREVIRYLRDYYSQRSTIPTVFETCDANGLDLDDLRKLFPDGYRRGACRMAGLPFFG